MLGLLYLADRKYLFLAVIREETCTATREPVGAVGDREAASCHRVVALKDDMSDWIDAPLTSSALQ